MTITSRQLSALLQYFSVQNSSNHILSLALTANNTFTTAHKQQTVAPERSTWDLLDTENSSTSLLFYQYIDNSSSVYYLTNDTFANRTKIGSKPRTSTEIPIWLIPCYSIILIFAIIGNLLVASTLFQNRRMRTITNVFLVNLAISDMLLGVLCMPITLAGTFLRHFVFGELVCKFIQFAQAISVAVSSWTLVAISCERYYAICHPLRSRSWQTINHAYKIIVSIWFGSIICMAPIAIFSQLIPTSQGYRKCREQWPEEAIGYERSYNIFLDLALLVLPLAILCVAYILITRTLYMGIQDEKALIFGNKNSSGVAGDAKMYTQVMTELKTPTIFHLNMSFRYHARKGTTSSTTGCCASNNKALQAAKTTTNSVRETKHLTSTGMINKYSLMGSISAPTDGKTCRRRGLCYRSSAITQAETKISLKDLNEETTQQTQSVLQPNSSDSCSINVIGCGEVAKRDLAHLNATTATLKTIPPPPTDELTTKPLDEQRSSLYRNRSASVKSLNCNSISAEAHKPDTDNASCASLNTIPKTHLNRSQYRHQSLNQRQLQQDQQQQQQQIAESDHQQQITEFSEARTLNSTPSLRITESALRRSNLEKNLESKKRVVKMLFVLVLEFFICWTPLYVINTVAMFIGPAIYEYVDYTTISFFQLLAYSSSCCNPITYCFMNASFRRAFVDTFKGVRLRNGDFWRQNPKTAVDFSVVGNSIAFTNSCTVVTSNTLLDSPRL